MLTFKPIKETGYYSPNNYTRNTERTMFVDNVYRLTYYINGNNVFCYYLGVYYCATVSQSTKKIEEIDLINLIMEHCSKPELVAEEIELD